MSTGDKYPTDLKDLQWELPQPLLPLRKRRGGLGRPPFETSYTRDDPDRVWPFLNFVDPSGPAPIRLSDLGRLDRRGVACFRP